MVFLIQFFYISGISHHFCGYLLSFQCPIAGSVSNSIKSVRLLSLWSSISQNLCIYIFFHFWWRYHLLSFLPPCSYLHWMFTSVINNCFLGLSFHHYSKNVLFFFSMLYLASWIWSHCPSLFFVYSTFWWKTAFSNFLGKNLLLTECVCVCVCVCVCLYARMCSVVSDSLWSDGL